MLKDGPLWAIYIASYFIDYVLVLVILIWKKISANGLQNLLKNMAFLDWLIWIALTVLIIFSLSVMKAIKQIKMTGRIKFEPKDDSVWEVYMGFLAPVLTLGVTIVGDYGVLLAFVIFIVTGIVFVKSKQVHYASVFIFPMFYSIFKCDGGIIITRNTIDGLRLEMTEDGIQAKELERRIYLVQ